MFFTANLALNPLAIFTGTAAHMFLGMLWYSPLLFGTIWAKVTQLNKKKFSMHAGHLIGAAIIGLTISLFLMHTVESLATHTCTASTQYALLLWLCLIATTHFSNVIWHGKSMQAYLIEVGFWAVDLSVISCIVTKLSRV